MLGQPQVLRLVIRADALAVESIGPGHHAFVDQAADDLAMLDNERHLAGTHLQYRPGTAPARARIAEARIEEARVMDAEFADQGIERHHFGGVVRRYLDGLLGGQDVELVRIKDQAAVAPRPDRFPKFRNVVAGATVHIDEAGMALGTVADEFVGPEADKVDANRDAVGKIGSLSIDETLLPMQRCKRFARQHGVTAAKPDLRQARPFAHQHREGAWADFGIKRTMVAGIDAVEAAGLVSDHPREDVEPAGRAFRIGGGRDVGRQGQAFHQRHDIDTAGLQHGAVAERDLMELQFVDAFADRRVRRLGLNIGLENIERTFTI